MRFPTRYQDRQLADWIAKHRWDHFVTLTFANPATPDEACQQFATFIRRIERRAHNGIYWFRVVERAASGRIHIHVLLGDSGSLSCASVEEAWERHGRSQVALYDPERGAIYYMHKAIDVGAEYDLSKRWRKLKDRDRFPRVGEGENGATE